MVLIALVKAARAGESGRWFSMLASEVRLSVTRSTAVTREIKGLIAT